MYGLIKNVVPNEGNLTFSAKDLSELQIFKKLFTNNNILGTMYLKNDYFLTIVVSIYLYKTEFNEPISWVSAENLWILGRYIVHLPLEEILKINLNEVSNIQ